MLSNITSTYDPEEFIDLDAALAEEELRSLSSRPENTSANFKFSLKPIDDQEIERFRLSLVSPISNSPVRINIKSPTESYAESVALFKNLSAHENVDFASKDLRDFMPYNMDDLVSRSGSQATIRLPFSSDSLTSARLNRHNDTISHNQAYPELKQQSSGPFLQKLAQQGKSKDTSSGNTTKDYTNPVIPGVFIPTSELTSPCKHSFDATIKTRPSSIKRHSIDSDTLNKMYTNGHEISKQTLPSSSIQRKNSIQQQTSDKRRWSSYISDNTLISPKQRPVNTTITTSRRSSLLLSSSQIPERRTSITSNELARRRTISHEQESTPRRHSRDETQRRRALTTSKDVNISNEQESTPRRHSRDETQRRRAFTASKDVNISNEQESVQRHYTLSNEKEPLQHRRTINNEQGSITRHRILSSSKIDKDSLQRLRTMNNEKEPIQESLQRRRNVPDEIQPLQRRRTISNEKQTSQRHYDVLCNNNDKQHIRFADQTNKNAETLKHRRRILNTGDHHNNHYDQTPKEPAIRYRVSRLAPPSSKKHPEEPPQHRPNLTVNNAKRTFAYDRRPSKFESPTTRELQYKQNDVPAEPSLQKRYTSRIPTYSTEPKASMMPVSVTRLRKHSNNSTTYSKFASVPEDRDLSFNTVPVSHTKESRHFSNDEVQVVASRSSGGLSNSTASSSQSGDLYYDPPTPPTVNQVLTTTQKRRSMPVFNTSATGEQVRKSENRYSSYLASTDEDVATSARKVLALVRQRRNDRASLLL